MSDTTDKVRKVTRRIFHAHEATMDGTDLEMFKEAVVVISAFRDAAYREGVEDAAKVVCPWCGNPEYDTFWHHEEWRHYRKTDMHVEYCKAEKIRSALLPVGPVDEELSASGTHRHRPNSPCSVCGDEG